MAAKYRKIDPRIWSDEKFSALSAEDKLLAIYCLTGQSNRIGFFKFSVALAAEDLNWQPDALKASLERVCIALRWKYDELGRVLLLPQWWKYNASGSYKTMIGCLTDLHDVPQSVLLQEFMENTAFLSPAEIKALKGYGKDIGMGMSMGIPKGMPSQEQEQEQEQEQDYDREGYPIENAKTATPPRTDAIKVQSTVIKTWNATAGVKHVRGLTLNGPRLKALRDVLGHPGWLDDFKTACRTKFPLKCSDRPDGWQPTIDWILKPENLDRVLEGAYDWKQQNAAPSSARASPQQRPRSEAGHRPEECEVWK